MTDFRALCTELLNEVLARPLILDRDLIDRARAAVAAAADGPAVPAGREPAAVAGEPSDEELFSLDQLRDAWDAQADAANCWDALGIDEIVCWAQKQALARWGRPAVPPAPAEGKVGEP